MSLQSRMNSMAAERQPLPLIKGFHQHDQNHIATHNPRRIAEAFAFEYIDEYLQFMGLDIAEYYVDAEPNYVIIGRRSFL